MRTLFAFAVFVFVSSAQLAGQVIPQRPQRPTAQSTQAQSRRGQGPPATRPRPQGPPAVQESGTFIVTFRPGTPAADKAAAVQASGARLRAVYNATNTASVDVPDAAVLARLRNHARVLGVFPNQKIYVEQGRGGGAGNTKPKPPASLTATAISENQINLSWIDASDNEDGFAIERCLGSACLNFSEIIRVGPNVVSYTDSGLAAQTPYRYRVLSFNVSGDSKYSNIATATTLAPPPPAAPSNLTSTPISFNRVDLSWADNSSNEDGFQVERCASGSCTNFAQVALLAANTTSWSDSGVAGNTIYRYRVRAFSITNGPSAYSNVSQANTPPPPPPAAPTNLTTAAPSHNQVNLSWSDNSSDEDGFQVERCTLAGCSNFAQVAVLAANSTSWSDSGVAGSTTYVYRVRAFNNANGQSGYSNSSQVTTPAAPPPPPPNAPSNLTTSAISYTRVDLSWSDNSTDEDGFQIERCASAGCNAFVEIAQVAANSTTWSDLGVGGNTTYVYRVRAFNNSNGPSGYSNSSQVTTPAAPPPPPPNAPSNLTTSAISFNHVDLSWSDNSSDEDGFHIERCTPGGCTSFVEIAQVAANTTNWSDMGVAGNTTYVYRVRAFNNANGQSGYSDSSQVTTPAPPPPSAPSNLTTSAPSFNRVDLNWSDNSSDEDGFQIERCTLSGCTNFVQIAQVAANITTWSDQGVAGNGTYVYRVRAFNNANGQSAYSNSSQVTTPAPPPPSAPSNLTTSAISFNRVDLAWSDNSSDEDGFQIERCTLAGCTNFAQVALVATNGTSWSDVGLAGNTTYRYRVRAYNGNGQSAYSNISQVTTPAAPPPPPPSAPSNLTTTAISYNHVELSWSDNSSDEDGFRIERCTGTIASCSSFVQIAQVATDIDAVSDLGVAGSTTYTYRVRAFNSNGQSAYSNPSQVTTPLAPPSTQVVPAGVQRIGAAPGAYTWTGTGVGVAVVDTGLDFAHVDLALAPEIPNVNSYNAFAEGTTCQDIHGHGTHVAGIIGAKNNDVDVVGVAPNATIYCVNVFQPDPVEGVAATDESLIAGLEWILSHANTVSPPIRVINMSLGREKTLEDNDPNHPLRVVVRALHDAGISVVVAAGNDPLSEVSEQVPAFYPEVMAVASTAAQDGVNGYDEEFGPCVGLQPIKADTASYFTTDGRFVSGTGVTISAPGETQEDMFDFVGSCFLQDIGILSLQAGGGTVELSGTSMASPHVAGVVALMWEKELSLGLNLAPETARIRLRNNAIRRGTAPLDSSVEEYTFDGEREGVVWAPSALQEAPPPPQDAPPAVTIVSPANNASFPNGTNITFTGTGTDPEDGNIASSLHWTSDRDGQIGTGASFTRTLSSGNHLITASLVDSGGNTGNASVSISVGSPQTPTKVQVASVTFTAVGSTLKYTFHLVNEFGGPVAGASIRASLYEWVYTGNLWFSNGVTDAQGNVQFQLLNFDFGCYTAGAENVVAPGLTWIPGTPSNNYCKL